MHNLLSLQSHLAIHQQLLMDSQRNFQTLKGKVALITGASRGLGAGFAYELARRGAKVSKLSKYAR